MFNIFIAGITGLLFSDRQEVGFSANRIWVASGFMCGFLTSTVLSVYAQLWFYVVVIILSFFSYTLLALLTKKKNELLPCCFRKSGDEDTNNSLKEEIDEGPVKPVDEITGCSKTTDTENDSRYTTTVEAEVCDASITSSVL